MSNLVGEMKDGSEKIGGNIGEVGDLLRFIRVKMEDWKERNEEFVRNEDSLNME